MQSRYYMIANTSVSVTNYTIMNKITIIDIVDGTLPVTSLDCDITIPSEELEKFRAELAHTFSFMGDNIAILFSIKVVM